MASFRGIIVEEFEQVPALIASHTPGLYEGDMVIPPQINGLQK